MAGNSFGQVFRITTYGESHGEGVGVIIDGCPSGIQIDLAFINAEMARRRPGQSTLVSQRKEDDEVTLQSGVFEGKSTGTPIHIFIKNMDHRSSDYTHISDKFRPSHADYTYTAKYGHRDHRGGGRSSARETAARVAAGAIAKMVLKQEGISIHAFVSQVGAIKYDYDPTSVDYASIESNEVRCPNKTIAEAMSQLIKVVKKDGDTIGGRVSCIIDGLPTGLGEPVFDKLHADLGKAMLSINAVKGFEYGSGFGSMEMRGSEHNDIFENAQDKIVTRTNNSGGIQGGISIGMPVYFNIAFKPVATIVAHQETVDEDGNTVSIEGKGRHDACVVPRAVAIVEAMAALVIVDHWMRNKIYEAK